MHDLPPNSLFAFSANPIFSPQDMAPVPMSAFAREMARAFATGKHAVPETDALEFYFLNHAFHTMQGEFHPFELLDPDMTRVAEAHLLRASEISRRILFHVLIISVDQGRYMQPQEKSYIEFLENSYGQDFGAFVANHFQVPGHRGGVGNMQDLAHLKLTAGEFCGGMVAVFAFGKWQNWAGGKTWVANPSLVSSCVRGSLSLEQMADQAFSLSHHGGSVFNKGYFYQTNSQLLMDILDVQDSGQIPQWIGKNLNHKVVSPTLRAAWQTMAKRFPEEMTGPVDARLIEESRQKRAVKEQAKAALKTGNNWNGAGGNAAKYTPPPPQQKMNNIITDLVNKGF
jgi:hypothetical protein